jgi:hypothetical protein
MNKSLQGELKFEHTPKASIFESLTIAVTGQ